MKKNRDMANKWAATWRAKNKDKIRESNKRWAEKNKELKRALIKRWIELNQERWKASKAAYHKAHPEKVKNSNLRRRSHLKNGENCSTKIKLLKLERFCRWCCIRLNDSIRVIDHVIPLSRGGAHIPDNLVASCHSCNAKKHQKLTEEWMWELSA